MFGKSSDKKTEKVRKDSSFIDTKHVDVIDGIRAVSILLVAFFHFWQQSWYSVTIDNDILRSLGFGVISTDWICRYGFLFVDMMILITGFCLFLPYARYMFEGDRNPGLPDPGNLWVFYKKRLVRIVPSYLFCFLVFLIFIVIPGRNYRSFAEVFKDGYLWKNIFAQLTFTQNLFPQTYLHSPFNGALWTVAVEMQFYLIFPLIAWAFRKKPLITFFSMHFISYIFIQFAVLPTEDGGLGSLINQLPAFLGVFANGMMAALVFVSLSNRLSKKRDKYLSILFTGLALSFIAAMCIYIKKGPANNMNVQRWQVSSRTLLAFFFAGFVICACFSAKWFRAIFSNKVAVFMAGISYNFYIWHQTVAVKMKEWRIPHWDGETPPNFTGDRGWQISYSVLIFVVSLALAAAITYGIEKPFTKLFMKERKKNEK